MSALLTLGFRTERLLQLHFLRHKDEYGVETPEEYLALADAFLGNPKQGYMKECHCTINDDILRYDKRSQDFGMLWHGYIVTMFVLDKGSNRLNEAYYDRECENCQGVEQ